MAARGRGLVRRAEPRPADPALDDRAARPDAGHRAGREAAAARGRGAATRAVRLLVALAWELGLRRVRLHAHVDNVASQRVAERAGLRRGPVERAAREVRGETWDVVWYELGRPG